MSAGWGFYTFCFAQFRAVGGGGGAWWGTAFVWLVGDSYYPDLFPNPQLGGRGRARGNFLGRGFVFFFPDCFFCTGSGARGICRTRAAVAWPFQGMALPLRFEDSGRGGSTLLGGRGYLGLPYVGVSSPRDHNTCGAVMFRALQTTAWRPQVLAPGGGGGIFVFGGRRGGGEG